jgi:hypothetical protein
MTFIAENIVNSPADIVGSPLNFVREVKCFSANSSAALQTLINAWLATLFASNVQYVVGTVNPYSAANNDHSAVVSYGYFVP